MIISGGGTSILKSQQDKSKMFQSDEQNAVVHVIII